MYIHKFVWIIFLMLSVPVMAQKTVLLEGQVLNDTIDRSNLNIVNISLKKGTTTSNSGVFEIFVREGDTINISALQYMSKQFVVNPTIYNRKKITLYLEPKITELDEVEISNVQLTGDIFKDVQNSKLKKQIFPSDLGIPENTAPPRTIEERRYYTAVTSSSGIPLDGLINTITGRLKMLKKHIEVSRFEKKVQEARYEFSDSLYMRELNIPQERIEDFVYYVFEDAKAASYVNTDNALGLLDYMILKSKDYLALIEQQD